MCCCDDNPPQCFSLAVRKARKPHQCSECGRTIAVGERYEAHSGLWDGGFDTFCWCANCSAAQKIVEVLTNDHCYCYTQLWEGVYDSLFGWGGIENTAVARLYVSAIRRKWTRRRGPRKGELYQVPTMPEMVIK